MLQPFEVTHQSNTPPSTSSLNDTTLMNLRFLALLVVNLKTKNQNQRVKKSWILYTMFDQEMASFLILQFLKSLTSMEMMRIQSGLGWELTALGFPKAILWMTSNSLTGVQSPELIQLGISKKSWSIRQEFLIDDTLILSIRLRWSRISIIYCLNSTVEGRKRTKLFFPLEKFRIWCFLKKN